GMIGLGFLSNPFFPESVASSISADGSVIVGYSFGFRDMQAVRWTEHGGIESLGELPGGALLSEATAVSADGSIIVGYAWDLGGMSHAFRWTPETGMVS